MTDPAVPDEFVLLSGPEADQNGAPEFEQIGWGGIAHADCLALSIGDGIRFVPTDDAPVSMLPLGYEGDLLDPWPIYRLTNQENQP